MKRVIEFPKPTALKIAELAPVISKKILYIADWAQERQDQPQTATVDSWPFCAA